MDFTGQTIVITGSARGIGLATARAFAARGGCVILSDIDERRLTTATAALESATRVLSQVCDVRDKEQVRSLVDFAITHTGRLDVWVNNAGVLRDDLLLRMDESDWNLVQDVNLKGAFFGIQAACRPMIKARRGRIVNLGSVSGFYGNGGQANYSAAKAGLMALTRSAARELAGRNITVNCVASGPIANEFTQHVPAAAMQNIMEQIPLKIQRNPEDAVAGAVRFLASDEADWITGATLRVDGGLMIGF